MYKKHLFEGVKKGAFDEAEAEKRFQAWMTEKEQKIQAGLDKIKSAKDSIDQSRFEAETKIKEERAQEIAKRRSDLIAAEESAAAEPAEEATEGTEAKAEELVEEAVATEAPAAEAPAKEEPKAEEPAKEEPKAEEPAKEEPKAEEPAKEEPKAEKPAADEDKKKEE